MDGSVDFWVRGSLQARTQALVSGFLLWCARRSLRKTLAFAPVRLAPETRPRIKVLLINNAHALIQFKTFNKTNCQSIKFSGQ